MLVKLGSSSQISSTFSSCSLKIQLIFLCYFITNAIVIIETVHQSVLADVKNKTSVSASANTTNTSAGGPSLNRRKRKSSHSQRFEYYLYSYYGSRGRTSMGNPQMPNYGSSAVRFYLYSSPVYINKYRIDEEIWTGNHEGLKHSNYKRKYPLIIILHGFLSNASFPNGEIDRISQAYFETKTKANIVGVDYAPLASPTAIRRPFSSLYYGQAIRNIPIVGTQLVEFIMFLLKSGNLRHGLDQVHIIGFSLGAHIAGYAGRSIYHKTGSKIDRITGLDPAGFLFHFRGKNSMLDASDANFVDITHTAQGFYGFHGKIGHVDFYINGGGPTQPGCINMKKPSSIIMSCSHSRAYKYYAESIRNPFIIACRCSICYIPEIPCLYPTSYGEHVDRRLRGSFNVDMKPGSWTM